MSKVLKRKPVIWDNIHANDYDQRRIFLGPFDGRPTELYQHLNGILTNPNCEYEINFVALHTIAQWIRCCASKLGLYSSKENTANSIKELNYGGEIKSIEVEMELSDTESCKSEGNDLTTFDGSETMSGNSEISEEKDRSSSEKEKGVLEMMEYDAKSALENAVHDWLKEFKKVKYLNKKHLDLSKSPSKLVALDAFSYLAETNSDDESATEKPEVHAKSEDIESEADTCCPYHMSGLSLIFISTLVKNSKIFILSIFSIIGFLMLAFAVGHLRRSTTMKRESDSEKKICLLPFLCYAYVLILTIFY